ncbi:MAG: citryl-CoA lyase [Candidatus Binatia bacterium]
MADQPKIVTELGKAELHRILVRGYDLTEELVGKITFTDMTFLMLVGRLPTPGEARMTDALLTILVEHGMVSNVVAARLIYHSAPEAIQGAVAAALLGAGSVHLGSSEWSAKMLQEALPRESPETDLDAIAVSVVDRYAATRTRIPGIGHRTHAEGDPRANRLFQIARETDVCRRYCELIQRISRVSEERRARRLPVNVTGAIAAIALDLGLPWQMTKAFALIGRTLGVMAHIGEEIRNPMAQNIDARIKAGLTYQSGRKT